MTIFSELDKERLKIVAKFIGKVKENIADDVFIQFNVDQAIFYTKLEALANKWLGGAPLVVDCDGARLVNKALHKEIENPLFIAIVVDDLAFFVEAYYCQEDANQYPLIFWMELACICGSQNIARYLLGKIEPNIWVKSNNIIPYVLSAGNNEFTMEVAKIAKAFGVANPGSLYLYARGASSTTSTIENIKQLFENSTVAASFER